MKFLARVGLVGSALWLSMAALSGCAASLAGQQPAAPAPTSTVKIAVLELPTPKPTTPPPPGPNATVDPGVTAPGEPAGGDGSGSPVEPEIGEITFALGVADPYEPINPGLLFTYGITEIHAIFDYSGMAPDDTWERVWYLNDQEVSRSSSLWTGPASGVFDYFINNGGKPLPAGDWVLELYVNGKLRALGVFIIEESPQ